MAALKILMLILVFDDLTPQRLHIFRNYWVFKHTASAHEGISLLKDGFKFSSNRARYVHWQLAEITLDH